jgi:uncharacterized protein DUF2877
MRPSPGVRAVGRRAHAALLATGGRLDAKPGVDVASYAFARGEAIFVAHGDVTMHPRTVVLDGRERMSRSDCLDVAGVTPWEHGYLTCGTASIARLRCGCDAVRHALSQLPDAQGLATLLIGGVPAFPLDGALPRARAFAAAIDAGDVSAIRTTSLALLGLGPGLTPSGDDFVGAALFARRVLMPSAREFSAESTLAADLIVAARQCTHPISAVLFADLVTGQSFAPLHRLAAAFETGGDDEIAQAARAVAGIGHSSGFDMLAGFVTGISGRNALATLQGTT